jgi:superfamily II DNA or RNA helicase
MSRSTFKPHPWQQNALDRLREARAAGADRGLVVMATGLGKTYTAAWFIEEWLEEQPDAKVLVLADKRNLLSQFDSDLRSVLEAHDVETETFQSMRNKIKADVLPHDFDLVIVDEAHHTAAPTYAEVADYLSPKFRLGLTATPIRGDGQSLDRWFGETLVDESLEKALALGHLTPVRYSVIADDLAKHGKIEIEGVTITKKQIDESVFAKERHEDMMTILQKRLANIGPQRTLIFCESIAHAELVASEIPNAVAIHNRCENTGELISQFRSGRISTVCAVNIFNEGIDIPTVDCLVFLRSTKSPIIWRQQLGRGLRRTTTKHAVHVLDFAANCDRLAEVAALQESTRAICQGFADTSEPPTASRIPTAITFDFDERSVDILERIRAIDYSDQLVEAKTEHIRLKYEAELSAARAEIAELQYQMSLRLGINAKNSQPPLEKVPYQSILRDILAIRRDDDKSGLWQDTIIERLQETFPNSYGDSFDRASLRKAVTYTSTNVEGIPLVKLKGIWIDGNRDGFRFDDIEKAIKHDKRKTQPRRTSRTHR